MRIFVTGAGGFVGSNLVRVFAEGRGAEVFAPDLSWTPNCPDLDAMLSRLRREMDDLAVTSAGATSCAGASRTTASRSSAASCRSASPSPPRGTRAERAAEIARERGYQPVFHHHTATYVEELPEIERFLADTDVALLLDSAISRWPAAIRSRSCATGERIGTIHLRHPDVGPGGRPGRPRGDARGLVREYEMEVVR